MRECQTDVIEDAMDSAADGLTQQELVGNCPFNARRLYDELQDRGITCYIVRGSCPHPEQPIPDTQFDVEELGISHWWVEARYDGEWYTLDLATEMKNRYGERVVTTARPPEYVPFTIDPDHSSQFAERI